MKRYVIYDLEENKYYTGLNVFDWVTDIALATKWESITEARTNLYKDGFPAGYYEIKEIFIRL